MAIIQEKPIGSPHPTVDPEWADQHIELAEKAIDMDSKPRQLAKEMENLARAGDPMALMMLKRLLRYGVTDALVNEIDANVHNICVFAVPEINYQTRKFRWRSGLDVRPSGWTQYPAVFQSDYEAFCFVLMRLFDAGITAVERCNAPAPKAHAYQESTNTCGNYFFSKSNRKWCSDTCQVRVSSRRATEKR